MSLDQFITNMLNIKSEQIQELLAFSQSDAMIIEIRLVDAHCACPYGNEQALIYRFVNTMNSVPCFLTGNKKSYLYGLTKKDTYAFNPKGLDNK